MTKRIYCFGNPAIPSDTLALELADELNITGYEFVKCASPEEIFEEVPPNPLIILDVAKGIKKVEVFSDLSKLSERNLLSLHDFDLSYFLKLMEKMRKLKKVMIIAVPMCGEKEEVKKSLERILG